MIQGRELTKSNSASCTVRLHHLAPRAITSELTAGAMSSIRTEELPDGVLQVVHEAFDEIEEDVERLSELLPVLMSLPSPPETPHEEAQGSAYTSSCPKDSKVAPDGARSQNEIEDLQMGDTPSQDQILGHQACQLPEMNTLWQAWSEVDVPGCPAQRVRDVPDPEHSDMLSLLTLKWEMSGNKPQPDHRLTMIAEIQKQLHEQGVPNVHEARVNFVQSAGNRSNTVMGFDKTINTRRPESRRSESEKWSADWLQDILAGLPTMIS